MLPRSQNSKYFRKFVPKIKLLEKYTYICAVFRLRLDTAIVCGISHLFPRSQAISGLRLRSRLKMLKMWQRKKWCCYGLR